MSRSLKSSVIIAVMVACAAANGLADSTSASNDMDLARQPETRALVKNGTVFVSMRPIFEFLGAKVVYDKGTISATKGDVACTLTLGTKDADVNGKVVKLTAAPFLLDGVTMVPLRCVGEAMGAQIEWRPTSSGGQATVALKDRSLALELSQSFTDRSLAKYASLRGKRLSALGDLDAWGRVVSEALRLNEAGAWRAASRLMDPLYEQSRRREKRLREVDPLLRACYPELMAQLPEANLESRLEITRAFEGFAAERRPWETGLIRSRLRVWERIAKHDSSKEVRTHARAVVSLLRDMEAKHDGQQ